ncbi:Ogg1p [Malassezia vespertilionis]|uniref:DNA-(apurinic or apyrimidinic site) lyase n=1 Tax=Malassezia vespertilionis TaxID=2020962 RepID=A0A2N1JFX3_9BASI|nr:Ogg1p [Malassezia vespertilionis]
MTAPAGYETLRLAQASTIALPLMIAHQCGQAFRWRKVAILDPHGPMRLEWSLCLRDRVVFLVHDQEAGCLYYRTLAGPKAESHKTFTASWLRDYLNLDKPTSVWYQGWCKRDPIFAKHAKRFAGANILRQDPWECMCAFICSSNNNIPRISQMVHKLCAHFSSPILDYTYPKGTRLCHSLDLNELWKEEADAPTLTYHPFPHPTRLAERDVESRLRALGFGYRAKYLANTAQALCDQARLQIGKPASDEEVNVGVYNYLEQLRALPYYEAREKLLQLSGIGPKVADCILLMSLDQPSSIPVDRHVFQFAERWYHIRSKRYEEVADKLRFIWGENAGWAHSVLFYADLPSFANYMPAGKVDSGAKQPTDAQETAYFPHHGLPVMSRIKQEPDTDPALHASPTKRSRTS